jgi:hypothetical protein
VVTHRERVVALVRRSVPGQHREEAAQVCAIGLLVALERYDDAKSGPDRGKKNFWGYALPYVRDELRLWMDKGVRWRNTKMSKAVRAAREAKGDFGSTFVSVEAIESAGEFFAAAGVSVDELAAESEALRLLRLFIARLTDKERAIIFSDSGRTRTGSLHSSLVERCKAFVRGSEGKCLKNTGSSSSSTTPRGSAAG